MGIEANAVKLVANGKIADKIEKTKNINKGNITHNKTSIKQEIVQNINQGVTMVELYQIIGIAKEQTMTEVREELANIPATLLKGGFDEVSPLFFAANATNENAKLQVDLLIQKNLTTSLKKQAIAAVGMLSQEDIALFKIIIQLNKFNVFSGALFHKSSYTLSQNNTIMKDEEIIYSISLFTKNLKNIIEEYTKKFGLISFNSFSSLLRQGVITNDGQTAKPIGEFILKSLLSSCGDKTKNAEYISEEPDKRMKVSRNKWTNWFALQKYPENIKKVYTDLSELVKLIPMRSAYVRDEGKINNLYSISTIGVIIQNSLIIKK